jgi:hypothetical protein
MFYFGPWERAGHFLWAENGGRVRDDQRNNFPWHEDSHTDGIDCQLQPGCRRDDCGDWRHGLEKEGEALLHHKNGWTALSFWDRTVDTRGGCNSTYFAEGTFTFEEMVQMSSTRFKERWDKMGFLVRLAP